jgi:four helix bundle protein
VTSCQLSVAGTESEYEVKTSRYQDLVAWQKAIAFVQRVYTVTSKFPQEEMFGLKSQMRRSVVSVPSNIAEGQGRASRGEFLQFLGHARGSLYELETQIVIASKLAYLSAPERDSMLMEAQHLGRILNGLIGSLKPESRATVSRQLTTEN